MRPLFLCIGMSLSCDATKSKLFFEDYQSGRALNILSFGEIQSFFLFRKARNRENLSRKLVFNFKEPASKLPLWLKRGNRGRILRLFGENWRKEEVSMNIQFFEQKEQQQVENVHLYSGTVAITTLSTTINADRVGKLLKISQENGPDKYNTS